VSGLTRWWKRIWAQVKASRTPPVIPAPVPPPAPIPPDPLPVPVPVPEPDGEAPVAPWPFTMHSPIHNYVSWPDTDRSGWPVREGTKPCNALLYINGRKVEWIPVGRENTGIKNVLEVGGKYYQPDVGPGSTVTVEIRDTAGKVRNAAYVGTVRL